MHCISAQVSGLGDAPPRHALQQRTLHPPSLPLAAGLLWTAPELLRDPAAPLCGTQKGDVYSFAIIVYEIYGKMGPYGDIDLCPKGACHEPRAWWLSGFD